ncbi:MAG TPA: glutamine-hydrolyzing GMP synthase, partial [Bacteroidetes bacterium]|nr:glutamine-hydrolyzing GMP synthase [Bacteroidota bacterium]
LSGSPFSVKDKNALKIDLDKIIGKYPVLGVCYGAQFITDYFGGIVEKSDKREYGKSHIHFVKDDPFFHGIEDNNIVWMSHADSIKQLPSRFEVIAKTSSIPVAIFKSKDGAFEKPVYGIQFHPEVTHTQYGKEYISYFLFKIAKCKPEWSAHSFAVEKIKELKGVLKDDKVVLGLSGGVDSSVAAVLLHKAIGKNLYCLFIDNGLLRKNEFEEVLKSYQGLGLNVKGIDAKDRFLDALKGVQEPEKKRKIIGENFIRVFEEEAQKIQGIKWLAQGTIYPDVIESVSVNGPSVTIKSHHNVGGLPEKLQLDIIEPLKMLFKDEVRRVGKDIGVPERILSRHPFPGPGLAIRILGDITREKVKLCQEADAVFIDALKESGWYDKVWQAGAILLNAKSVGVMGDERTYEYVVALRCVNSVDGMTADWSDLPHQLLGKIANTIINNIKGINRVVYDISTKPPSTIEWE